MKVVIVPGINGSGPEHWQTLWEKTLGGAERIAPASWDEPDLDDWLAAIDRAVDDAPEVLFVAHSMGCLASVEWVARNSGASARLFLVAPPDPEAPGYPVEADTFQADARIEADALLVVSDDDPFCAPDRSRVLAERWGAELVSVGEHGHLNAASGIGDWPEGRALFDAFAGAVASSGGTVEG